jgi:PAS domain S-box-containing protein
MRATKFLLFIAPVIFLFPGLWSRASDLPKRVLLLDSYGRNVAHISNIISVFKTELSSRSPEPIDLHEVSLEMARFAQIEQEVPFVNFLRERFSDRNPDLVVSMGAPAFTFLARHRQQLFPESPLLFAAVPERLLASPLVPKNTVVAPVQINLKGMIEDILQVLPGTENIAVILGASQLETFWLKECRREFAAFSSRVNFTYLNGLPFEKIRSRAAALPPNSVIFFGLLIVDASGTVFDPGEALKGIMANANSPVFTLIDSLFGFGTLGGRLIQERTVGLHAADLALRILQGESPANLSVPTQVAGAPVYDWRALQRWGISESRLPQGSTVLFRQPSMWELYHWRITAAAVLLIFQTILICTLLVQMRLRKRTERELKKSEQRLHIITNALPVLIAYVDADQRYRFNNDAYKTWFGLSPEEAWGRTIREVVRERLYRNIMPYVEQVLSGKKVHFTQDIELDGGRLLSAEIIYVPDMDGQGAVRGFYTLAIDVTERNLAQQESKRLHDELLHASRISTAGEFAGALAHELNQPLSAIMSNAQAARRYLDTPACDLEEIKEILDDIVKEDERAGEIINRLRALLKKTQTDFELVDLNLILREVLGLLHSDAVTRDVEVHTELDSRLPLVRGDRIQLQQVALNLILNGFDATSERPRGERRALIRTCLEDSQALVAVTDSGKGISSGEAEKVFKPFYTSKPQGLGMGLSISRSIINRHQGRIWVENNPDGGATFYFSLRVPTD